MLEAIGVISLFVLCALLFEHYGAQIFVGVGVIGVAWFLYAALTGALSPEWVEGGEITGGLAAVVLVLRLIRGRREKKKREARRQLHLEGVTQEAERLRQQHR